MSSRAACRLEQLGFEVYDYAPGKEDWSASGLPTEGRDARIPRAGDIAIGAPTCEPSTTLSEVSSLLAESDSEMCIVTTDDGVVLGRIRKGSLEGNQERRAESVMETGPTTIRMNELLAPLVERLRKADVDDILVTTPLGELRGIFYREEGEKALETYQREHRDRRAH